MRSLKILFLSIEYPPTKPLGGIGTYMSIIAPALAAHGHIVHVLSCYPGREKEDYQEKGVFVHRRDFIKLKGISQLQRYVKIPLTIFRFLAGISNYLEYKKLGISFDVVEYPDTNAEGWLFAFLKELPLVCNLHTPTQIWGAYDYQKNLDFKLACRLERYAVENADELTSPSYLLVKHLKKLGWLRNKEVKIIRLPLDWSYSLDTQSLSQTKPVVIFVGRLERCKAPEVLLKAIKILKKDIPEIKVFFIGRSRGQQDGIPYIEWLKKLTEELDSCEFLDDLPRDKIKYFLNESRVLAAPSRFDNYPFAVIEAMAAARPVVISEKVGVAELIQDTISGKVVPVDNPYALADALRSYLKDIQFAEKAGSLGQRLVREHHAPEKIAFERQKVYEEAIDFYKRKIRKRSPRILFSYVFKTWQEASVRPLLSLDEELRWAIPKRIGNLEVSSLWIEWAKKEALHWPGYHFYLKTAYQFLRLIIKHPLFKKHTDLCNLKILDVGCTPAVSVLFACMGAEVILLDINLKELEKAREYARILGVEKKMNFIQADLFNMPFKTEAFDIVWNSGVIEHFDNPLLIIKNMREMTKSEGAIIVFVPNLFTPHSLFIRSFLRLKKSYPWDCWGRERSYTLSTLVNLFKKNNLSILATIRGNLRRSFIDDYLVIQPLANRIRLKYFLLKLINLSDIIEEKFPFLNFFGFMIGIIAIKKK